MKTNTFLSAIVTSVALATSALAIDGGNSARQGTLFNGESGDREEAIYDGGPRILSLGAYVQYQKRGVTDDSDFVKEWRIRHLMTYIGCDVLPWMTLEGGIGQSNLGSMGDDRSSDLEWMGGLDLRLLDYMLIEPVVGNDTYWFGLNSHFQYTGSQSDGVQDDVKWSELFGSLTMRFTARPERYGFMDRISLYFGPAFSLIRGTEGSQNITEDQAVGFVGGLEFVPSDNITFKIEALQFDKTSLGGSIAFHF